MTLGQNQEYMCPISVGNIRKTKICLDIKGRGVIRMPRSAHKVGGEKSIRQTAFTILE